MRFTFSLFLKKIYAHRRFVFLLFDTSKMLRNFGNVNSVFTFLCCLFTRLNGSVIHIDVRASNK